MLSATHPDAVPNNAEADGQALEPPPRLTPPSTGLKLARPGILPVGGMLQHRCQPSRIFLGQSRIYHSLWESRKADQCSIVVSRKKPDSQLVFTLYTLPLDSKLA